MKFSKILLTLLIFFSVSAKAQLDLEHWFPPIYSTGANIDSAILSLSTDKTTPFKVYLYNGNNLIDSVTVDKINPIEYDLELANIIQAVL